MCKYTLLYVRLYILFRLFKTNNMFKGAMLTWKQAKAHCENFGKFLMEGSSSYETKEKRRLITI